MQFETLSNYHIGIYALTVFMFIYLIEAIGKRLVILEFIGFSAVLLWLTVPTILKTFDVELLPGMQILAVEENVYYAYAFPGTIALIIGLLLPISKRTNDLIIISKLENYLKLPQNKYLPLLLLTIGVMGKLIRPFLPASLAFIFHLVSEIIFVATMYSIFVKSSLKILVVLITIFITIITVISTGMFNSLVWWSLSIFMIISLRYRYNFLTKLSFAILGLFFILILQLTKLEYRAIAWWGQGDSSRSNTEIFFDALTENVINFNSQLSNVGSARILIRANQAELSSKVLAHVPFREPYAKGETIFLSLAGSFVPRFLWPDKPKSGGRESMRRFAGVILPDFVSMDIAQLGDGYANFGKTGGIIFLFFYGLFNNILLRRFLYLADQKYPSLLLWCPFIFIQLLKVEVGVETNFNAAIKGAFFVIAIYYLFRKVLKIKL